eukprot:13981845-Alexandrium_andersonii.AAC.1
MSASLVGSEMCIRDSLPSGAPAPGPPREASARNNCAECTHPEPQGQFWAVSYTHLTLPTICSV